ncbi:DUF4296 domain-containing protein [Tenacibaculum soleae]|uniref:DUF4296 domain-containing protein n=1 Tax=Tenacibaculum soleae TaxID=447689 RepID=A0A1B9Y0T3_9FLAO|nr:DUF4296 domain-containing protein [Tenacibaculum soleae]MDO6811481.1 DUF4296 domain-containing protein [Tenacibaculum soleae]OCK43369.1 hypothetical protein BA195_01305 [Tenacibaculum soleae]
MKKITYIIVLLLITSCTTSNTIYKAPKSLIPKDSMVILLTDMYIASSAENVKNKFLKKEKNYMMLVYEKYKIDSLRFDLSNKYYTSEIEEYSDMIKEVKKNLDSIETYYIGKDTLRGKNKKIEDKLILEEDFKEESKVVFKRKPLNIKKRE